MRGRSEDAIRQRRLAIAFLVSVGAIALLVTGALGGAAPAQPPAPPPPNVVLVMTDDQTVEQMGALDRVRNRIGRAGTTFTTNFATFPLCCPSRATYLTGQYAHNHTVLANRAPAGGYYKLDSSNTLPVWLREAGYATAHIGKYLNGYGTRDPREVPPGWEEWQGSVDPTTYNFFDYCLNVNGRLVTYGTDPRFETACPGAEQRPRTYQGDLYTNKAVDFINRRAPAEQPFFLSVAYLAPHGGRPNDEGRRCRGSAKPAPRHGGLFAEAPLPRPPGFNEPDVSDKPTHIRTLLRLDRGDIDEVTRSYRCRRESLLAVDEGVGAMLDALSASGELDDTLFVFTSDNGFFQGEHRVKSGKSKVHEPSVRVPLLMRGPGVPADKRVPQLAGNIDLAPTILDAANAWPGRAQDGVSLIELAQRPTNFADRDILLEIGPTGGTRNPQYTAIRTPRYKYVEYRTGERELYDLTNDAFEQRSVHASASYARVRDDLARRLTALRLCSGATCR